MNVKFCVSYKIGKKGIFVVKKKKYLLMIFKLVLCVYEFILI